MLSIGENERGPKAFARDPELRMWETHNVDRLIRAFLKQKTEARTGSLVYQGPKGTSRFAREKQLAHVITCLSIWHHQAQWPPKTSPGKYPLVLIFLFPSLKEFCLTFINVPSYKRTIMCREGNPKHSCAPIFLPLATTTGMKVCLQDLATLQEPEQWQSITFWHQDVRCKAHRSRILLFRPVHVGDCWYVQLALQNNPSQTCCTVVQPACKSEGKCMATTTDGLCNKSNKKGSRPGLVPVTQNWKICDPLPPGNLTQIPLAVMTNTQNVQPT